MNEYVLALFIFFGILLFTQGLKRLLRKSLERTTRNNYLGH